jgi:hypothetical protein
MLSRAHLSIRRRAADRMTTPDFALLTDVVAERVLDACRVASDSLRRSGVRHVVVGALAVGAHGYPRATKDVDFLVGEEAFTHHAGGIVTMHPGLPIEVDGVPIDYLSPRDGEEHLASALDGSPGACVDAARLIYMKLKASRLRDRGDIVGLVNAGVDVDACRAYLVTHAPGLVASFDDLVRRAADEI